MVNSTRKLVDLAYRKLKQESYYDTVDLFLRQRVAEFEDSPQFNERLDALSRVVEMILSNAASSTFCSELNGWLEKVSFRLLPKSVSITKSKKEKNDNKDVSFITNYRSAQKYHLKALNYFIDAPIELHILDVIWCLKVGARIDEKLVNGCLGNRMLHQDGKQSSFSGLFKIFHRQYSEWRDTAIKRAQNALENKSDVLLIGLDIKQCFYHLEADWSALDGEAGDANIGLNRALRLVYDTYHQRISQFLSVTHKTAQNIQGLPIGLASSKVICNWLLGKFDNKVRNEIHPIYYGRYVDDILIVVQRTLPETQDSKQVIHDVLVSNGVLRVDSSDEEQYSIYGFPHLKIQLSKFVIQYFDHRHSHAGLKQFKRDIDAQASEFRFLPHGDDQVGLDNCAFDVIYKGSVNKLRSVIGLEENSTELSKYLSRKLLHYRLCREGASPEHIEQLFRFYKGKNIFDFCRLWEKVFTLLLVNNNESACARFHKQCVLTLEKLAYSDSSEVEDKIKTDVAQYLTVSLALPLALKAIPYEPSSKAFKRLFSQELKTHAEQFRHANMMRHQYVAWPLLNYTSYTGDLSDPETPLGGLNIDWTISARVRLSPRYIHIDEYQLFRLLAAVSCGNMKDGMSSFLIETAHDDGLCYYDGSVSLRYDCIFLGSEENESDMYENTTITVGIANMKVREKDIESAYTPHKRSNLSIGRQAELYGILNEAIRREKCDLLVLPEVSVPPAWLPVMVSYARKQQVALVFGLEHWVSGKNAYNIVITLLPFKTHGMFNSCFVSARLKNHYAPREKDALNRLGLTEVSPNPKYYELFSWRGVHFTVYNCFELSDISHRGLMRSRIDMMVAVAWNKDTPYYSNIIESATRDLHAYVIHVNTSDYGDSRVVAPKSSVELNMVRVKGGINTTILKTKLDISNVRDFQSRTPNINDQRFKPTPAGYAHESARNRACGTLYGPTVQRFYEVAVQGEKCDDV